MRCRLLAAASLAAVSAAHVDTHEPYSLVETYDASNFFTKFDFYQNDERFNPVQDNRAQEITRYLDADQAHDQALTRKKDDSIYIGVDHESVIKGNEGRPTVRIESKKSYKSGLFIAHFSHLPQPGCGVSSTFSMEGLTQPIDGRIRVYNVHDLEPSKCSYPAFSVAYPQLVGICTHNNAGVAGYIKGQNCNRDEQPNLKDLVKIDGCIGTDFSGSYGNPKGGVFAVERTDSYIRIFAWSQANVPPDVLSSRPDPEGWGKPIMEVQEGTCRLGGQFGRQKLVLDIDFCSGPNSVLDKDWNVNLECRSNTHASCHDYVRASPDKFKEAYWGVENIRVFRRPPSDEVAEELLGFPVMKTDMRGALSFKDMRVPPAPPPPPPNRKLRTPLNDKCSDSTIYSTIYKESSVTKIVNDTGAIPPIPMMPPPTDVSCEKPKDPVTVTVTPSPIVVSCEKPKDPVTVTHTPTDLSCKEPAPKERVMVTPSPIVVSCDKVALKDPVTVMPPPIVISCEKPTKTKTVTHTLLDFWCEMPTEISTNMWEEEEEDKENC